MESNRRFSRSALRRLPALLYGIFLSAYSAHGAELPLKDIKLPPGFEISIYAGNLPNARSLALSPKGTLFVGSLKEGKVYAVVTQPGETEAKKIFTIAQGLNMPNGVAFRNGALYVAEVNRVLRYDDIESRLANPPKPVTVNDQFPKDRHHGWKFIAFGPDGLLYVPVGAPCNICEPDDNRYALISRLKADGTGTGGVCSGYPQYRGLRLASGDQRSLVHRQRGR